MRHSNNDDDISFNCIEKAVRKVAQHFLTNNSPMNLRSERELDYLINRFMHRSDERQTYPGGFALVIPRSLPEFLIRLGQELDLHDSSEIALLNTSSAGMPCTRPAR